MWGSIEKVFLHLVGAEGALNVGCCVQLDSFALHYHAINSCSLFVSCVPDLCTCVYLCGSVWAEEPVLVSFAELRVVRVSAG